MTSKYIIGLVVILVTGAFLPGCSSDRAPNAGTVGKGASGRDDKDATTTQALPTGTTGTSDLPAVVHGDGLRFDLCQADGGTTRTLFDFDSTPAPEIDIYNGAGFTMLPVPTPPTTTAPAPGGDGLSIDAEAGTVIAFENLPGSHDWTNVRCLGLWIYRAPQEVAQRPIQTMELRLADADGRAWHWRRVDVPEQGWSRIELPLRWFRWSEGRPPTVTDISRLAIRFRDPGALVFDSIDLVDGDPGDGLMELADLAPVLFPEVGPDKLRTLETDRVRVLTDAPDLNLDQLAAHLGDVHDRVLSDMPFLPAVRPEAMPTMVVFADDETYRGYPERFTSMLNADLGNGATTTGFAMRGIAASTWSDHHGTLRPVYAHEYVHALIACTSGATGGGDWLQEGLATYYQLQFHPQDNIAQIVTDGIASGRLHDPLNRLCSGDPIHKERYWQAATVVEMLINDEQFSAKLPALFEAFTAAKSSDLGPHLETVLGADWDELTASWMAWCGERYRVDER